MQVHGCQLYCSRGQRLLGSVFSQIDDDVKGDSGAAVPMDALQNEEQLEASLGRKTEQSLSRHNLPAGEFTWNIFYDIILIWFVVISLFVHRYS